MTRFADGRPFYHFGPPLPTLRVCVQCGAFWTQSAEGRRFRTWFPGTTKHVGPHDWPATYRRTSGWPRL